MTTLPGCLVGLSEEKEAGGTSLVIKVPRTDSHAPICWDHDLRSSDEPMTDRRNHTGKAEAASSVVVVSRRTGLLHKHIVNKERLPWMWVGD